MSQELHQLIKSLSKGEKRAIVLSAEKTDGVKSFIELYYALMAQDVYDEKQLVTNYKDCSFVKHLGFSKNYLQNFILKELRQLNTGYKVSIKIKNYLVDIELLFWRGQFKLAIKLINLAKGLAEKYEYFLMLEELYYWERRIYTSGSMKIPKISNKSADTRFHIMEVYFNTLEYKKIINEVTAIIKESDEVRDEKDLKVINDIISTKLLSDIDNAKSIKAKYDFFILNASLHRLKGDFEKSISYHKLLLHHINQYGHIFIEENPIFYLAECNNVMLISLQVNDWELYNNTYIDVTNRTYLEEYSKAYYDSRIFIYLLSSAIRRKDYESVKHLIDNKSVLSNDLVSEEIKLLINYYCIIINYNCKAYKSALIYANEVINLQGILRVDVVSSALIFNTLIHYELGNYDYLDILVKKSTIFLKKNRLLSLYDATFLKLFSKVAVCTDKKQINKVFIDTKNRLENIKNKKVHFEEIDYIEWLSSRIK